MSDENPEEPSALIGFTGFVGSTLLSQRSFSELYSSRNIVDISGRNFDHVVCAGAPAQKWLANKEPEADRANLLRLMEAIAGVRSQRFTLISTVDVYPDPRAVFERDRPVAAQSNAYGRHRLELEDFVRRTFKNSLIVRLPALYGRGLRKNALYDLIHKNELDKLDGAWSFQWYGMGNLAENLERSWSIGAPLVNMTSEPVELADIQSSFWPGISLRYGGGPSVSYDVRSQYAEDFGGVNGYMRRKDEVMADIAEYLRDPV